jgi:hypothetical protein
MLQTAEQILRRQLGRPVVLQPGRCWESSKSTVMRCLVRADGGGPAAVEPSSVIVKRAKISRVLDDWAACLFLEQLPQQPALCPRCYGGDAGANVVVLEDLGDGHGLRTDEILLGEDPRRAAAALLEEMRLLGRLHAATAGRAQEYADLRASLGPLPPAKPLYEDPWSTALGHRFTDKEVAGAVACYRAAAASVGVNPPAGFDQEIERITARVEADPGEFLAFGRGDTNAPGISVRTGTGLRLFDFDCGGFRHALIEGLAGWLTWGCNARIPSDVVLAMDAAYRVELQAGCAAARDEEQYGRALVEAAGRWHLLHVISRLPTALERDYLRGWTTTLRQQLLGWLDAFADLAERAGDLVALSASARAVVRALRARWGPESLQLPFYPAFRGT